VGVLIPSTPGYHKPRPQKKEQVLGYLKVRQAILKYIPSPPPPPQQQQASSPIICQFSSIGSLSQKYLNALWSAWDVASVHRVVGPKKNKKDGADNNNNNLQLIYPTVDEIFRSVEGVHGGSSVPGRQKNVMKQFLLPRYRKWAPSSSEDDALQKGQYVPHLKTYYQIDDDGGDDNNDDSMKWFVLSSHNLSKGKKFVRCGACCGYAIAFQQQTCVFFLTCCFRYLYF
jgi:tyrosyl-DNA phosphodiesterase-1